MVAAATLVVTLGTPCARRQGGRDPGGGERRQTATAGAGITDYLGLVNAQTGKKLTRTQAGQLTTDATTWRPRSAAEETLGASGRAQPGPPAQANGRFRVKSIGGQQPAVTL
jgi:hypothetical protein